jgi:hypothetical protein
MEAAGMSKLGRGESELRQKERNRASKNVREGLMKKETARRNARLQEVRPLICEKCVS